MDACPSMFAPKAAIRKAIQDAQLPYTYVVSYGAQLSCRASSSFSHSLPLYCVALKQSEVCLQGSGSDVQAPCLVCGSCCLCCMSRASRAT